VKHTPPFQKSDTLPRQKCSAEISNKLTGHVPFEIRELSSISSLRVRHLSCARKSAGSRGACAFVFESD
jgi:hypothetical protein